MVETFEVRKRAGTGGDLFRFVCPTCHHLLNFTNQNMAAEEENIDLEEETPVENKGKKVAKHDSGAADLEKVTDYVEEAEISSQDISNVRNLRFFQYRSNVYT